MRNLLNITLLFSTIIHYNNTYCMESLPEDKLQQTQAFNNINDNSNILNESKLRQETTSNIHDQDIMKNMPDGKEQQIPYSINTINANNNISKIMNLKKKRANSTGKYLTSIDAINNIKKSNNNNIINLKKKRSKSDGKYSASINAINDKISPAKIQELEDKLHTINNFNKDKNHIDTINNNSKNIKNANVITNQYTGNESQQKYRNDLKNIQRLCLHVGKWLQYYKNQFNPLFNAWHEVLNNDTTSTKYSMQNVKVMVNHKPIKLIQYLDDVKMTVKRIASENNIDMAINDFNSQATGKQKESAINELWTLASSIDFILKTLLESCKSNRLFLLVLQSIYTLFDVYIRQYKTTHTLSHLYQACTIPIDKLITHCRICNNELLLCYRANVHHFFHLNDNYFECQNKMLYKLRDSISKTLADKSTPILASDMENFIDRYCQITFPDTLICLQLNTDDEGLNKKADKLVNNMTNDLLELQIKSPVQKICDRWKKLYIILNEFRTKYIALNNKFKAEKQTRFKVPSVQVNNKEIKLDEYCNNIKNQLQDIVEKNKELMEDKTIQSSKHYDEYYHNVTNELLQNIANTNPSILDDTVLHEIRKKSKKMQVGNTYCTILESMFKTLAQSLAIDKQYLQDEKCVKYIPQVNQYLLEGKYVDYIIIVTKYLLDQKYSPLSNSIEELCVILRDTIKNYRIYNSNYSLFDLHKSSMQVLDRFIKQCDIINNELLISTINGWVDSIGSEQSTNYIEKVIFGWCQRMDSKLQELLKGSVQYDDIKEATKAFNNHLTQIDNRFFYKWYANTKDEHLSREVTNLVRTTYKKLFKTFMFCNFR